MKSSIKSDEWVSAFMDNGIVYRVFSFIFLFSLSYIWVAMQMLLDIFSQHSIRISHMSLPWTYLGGLNASRRIIYRFLPSQLLILSPGGFSRHTLYIDVQFPHRKNFELSLFAWTKKCLPPHDVWIRPWRMALVMCPSDLIVHVEVLTQALKKLPAGQTWKPWNSNVGNGEARYSFSGEMIWEHTHSAQVQGWLARYSDSCGSAASCSRDFLLWPNMISEM